MSKQVCKSTGAYHQHSHHGPFWAALRAPCSIGCDDAEAERSGWEEASLLSQPSGLHSLGTFHFPAVSSHCPVSICQMLYFFFYSFQNSSLGSISPENGWQIILGGFRSFLQLSVSFWQDKNKRAFVFVETLHSQIWEHDVILSLPPDPGRILWHSSKSVDLKIKQPWLCHLLAVVWGKSLHLSGTVLSSIQWVSALADA